VWLPRLKVGYQTERNKLPAENNHKMTKGKKSINNKTRDSNTRVAALNSKRKVREERQAKESQKLVRPALLPVIVVVNSLS
jgi:hypothetical protein